jgi:hypothetical protein
MSVLSPRLRLLRNISAMALLAAGLAACGGGGGGDAAVVTPPPPVAPLEDFFGAAFGSAFRLSSTATPIDPKAGDIIPLDLTASPHALHS